MLPFANFCRRSWAKSSVTNQKLLWIYWMLWLEQSLYFLCFICEMCEMPPKWSIHFFMCPVGFSDHLTDQSSDKESGSGSQTDLRKIQSLPPPTDFLSNSTTNNGAMPKLMTPDAFMTPTASVGTALTLLSMHPFWQLDWKSGAPLRLCRGECKCKTVITLLILYKHDLFHL